MDHPASFVDKSNDMYRKGPSTTPLTDQGCLTDDALFDPWSDMPTWGMFLVYRLPVCLSSIVKTPTQVTQLDKIIAWREHLLVGAVVVRSQQSHRLIGNSKLQCDSLMRWKQSSARKPIGILLGRHHGFPHSWINVY